MEKHLYAEIYIICLCLLIIILSVIFQKKNKVLSIEQRLFGTLLIMDFFALATDLISWLINGVVFEGSRLLHIVDYTIFYVFSGLVFFFWFMYVIYILYCSKEMIFKRLPFHLILLITYTIICVSSPFTNWVFIIDEANVYNRGPLFMIVTIYSIICMITVIFETVYYIFKFKGTHSLITYINIVILPIAQLIATILQILFYGIALIWPITAVCFVYIFMTIQDREISTDQLTGLRNRRDMDYYINFKRKSLKDNKLLFAMYCDLHNFKMINDKLGHMTGDEALKASARILSDSLNNTDGLAFRIGGDEFAIIGERKNEEEIQKLRKLIELNCHLQNINEERFEIQFDVGYSIYQKDQTIKEWLDAADNDMYKNKRK